MLPTACGNKGNKGTLEKVLKNLHLQSPTQNACIQLSKRQAALDMAELRRGGKALLPLLTEAVRRMLGALRRFCRTWKPTADDRNAHSSCWDLLPSYSTVPPSSFGTCEAKLKSKPKDLASQVKIHLNLGTPSPNLGPIETH